jgi:hypothetical protein
VPEPVVPQPLLEVPLVPLLPDMPELVVPLEDARDDVPMSSLDELRVELQAARLIAIRAPIRTP